LLSPLYFLTRFSIFEASLVFPASSNRKRTTVSLELDVTSTRTPIVNALFIGAALAIFILAFIHVIPGDVTASMSSHDWTVAGLLGSSFVHENLIVLLANMFFLWVFGNAVCSTVGNLWYMAILLILELMSSSMYIAGDAGSAPGAAGIVSGIVGMSLLLFPSGKVYTMTAIWLATDIAAIHFWGHGEYWLHVAAFLGGAGVAGILLTSRAVVTFDPTMIDLLTGNKPRNIIDTPEPLQEVIHSSGSARASRTFVINGRRGGHVDPEAERIHRLMTGETRGRLRPMGIDPPLDLRVLRLKAEATQTTCYFIYEGEEIHDLSATGPAGVTVAVHPPKVIRRGEPGWFTFFTTSGSIPSNPQFIFEYTTASGERHRRTMAFSEYDRRILSGAKA
jgi:membrane associated rhomboid family serine protease